MNINGDKYLRMVQEFCVPELSAVANMQQVIFQQDGALAHCSREVRAFLHGQFPDRWIGRRGPIELDPRSPGLPPLEFFCGVTSSRKSMEQGLRISQHLKNALQTHVHQ